MLVLTTVEYYYTLKIKKRISTHKEWLEILAERSNVSKDKFQLRHFAQLREPELARLTE